MGSTNYFNTFIEIAEDCAAQSGQIPPIKEGKMSVANLQFEMLQENPYRFTSDDVLFSVFAMRKGIPDDKLDEQREIFFSRGQPCFRASPLTKTYGWGIHSNEEGKVAIYGVGTDMYEELVADTSVVKKKAMRSKRAQKR